MKIFHSLKTRLLIAISFVLFVVISGLSVLCYRYISRKSAEDTNKYFVEKVDGISLQMEHLIEQMDTVSSQILASRTLQEMFVNANRSDYENKNYFEYNAQERIMAQDVIWTFNSPKRQLEGINVFSASSYVGQRYSPSVTRIQEIAGQDIWKVPEDEKYIILGPHIDEWETLEEKEVISLVRPFIATCYGFQSVGIIEVQEKLSIIKGYCQSAEQEHFQILILDRAGNAIYQSGGTEDFHGIQKILGNQKEQEVFELSNEYMAAYSGVDAAGWKVVILQPKKGYLFNMRQQLLYVILGSLGVAVIIYAAFYLLVNRITRPVLQLASELEQLTELEQMPNLTESNMYEIQVFQNSVIRLLQRLNDSAKELMLANETGLSLRIMGMQAQINPHFLYNSLTAISAVASEENSQKVPVMCYQLSELFRYSSSHDSQVTLEQELDHIRTYLDFMKWRYEDNFDYAIDTSGDAGGIQIARQSLQPLVENSFTHGFKGTYPPYRIDICCKVDTNRWSICVSDNGIGFTEEKIREISQEIFKIDDILLCNRNYELLDTKNMAILNIYVRLKLQYKQALNFEIIRDQELKGAKVAITVDQMRGK